VISNYSRVETILPTISTSAALTATATQELPTTLDSQSGILAVTLLIKSNLDNSEQLLQVAVADNKQE
jgi:hypothetical protein